MPAITATRAVAAPAPPLARRARLARLERPLLLAGLALITEHLLEHSFAGPDTTLLGVLAIAGAAAGWAALQPRLSRFTRAGLAAVIGALCLGFGAVSHGLHIVAGDPELGDVSGIALIAGGIALLGSAAAAAAAQRVRPRRSGPAWSLLRGASRLAGAVLVVTFAVVPFAVGLMTTHSARWPIRDSALTVPHADVRLDAGGHTLAGWYVGSRNGAAVLVVHGSGGSRAATARHVELLARHGYGVLAIDLPGNGESSGRPSGFGSNAQPALAVALDWLAARPAVRDGRIAGLGLSLGAEVLLERAARDGRLRAVVADGATRPMDADRVTDRGPVERIATWLGLQADRAISGTRQPGSLADLMPRIAPRPVLLIAAGDAPPEVPANRLYRRAGGPHVTLWELPGVGHTRGLAARPAVYERRVAGFLDGALGR
jgi:uncharacterized protein